MAARAIQGAWRYRRTIKRGTQYAARNFRAMKKRRVSKVARRAKSDNVRNPSMKLQHGYPTGPATAVPMGNLQSDRFPWPAYSSSIGINTRTRNVIKVKGIKICRRFEYSDSNPDIGPIEVHWALVQGKDPDMNYSSLDYQNDFFRDNGTGSTRSQNFPTYVGTSPWSMLMNCAAINPNNKLRVLTHQRRVLDQYSLVAGRSMKHVWKIDRYYKMMKNIAFDNTSDTEPQNQIFEIFWYNTVMPSKFPADPTANQWITTDRANTVYWANMR